MTVIAPHETPHVGIFWMVQIPDGEARLLAAGCWLDEAEPYGNCLTYGPGHYETWAQWRRGRRIDPILRAIVRGLRIRRLAVRTHRLQPVARSVHYLCRSQAPDTGNDRLHQNPISFAAERTEVQSDMHYQSKETPNGVEIYRTAHIAISARRKSQCLASPECDFELCLQVLQSEIQINAIAEGYDPTIGIMHEGRDSSSAFIFDLMEPEGSRLIVECWNSSRYMCSIRPILLFGRMVCVGLIQRWRGAW
jgi:hypothetical protein